MSASNPNVKPDLAGFVNARAVLFASYGVSIAFLIPVEPVYAAGVPLNPFGEPIDPWMHPQSGSIEGTGWSSAYASGLVISRPYGGRGQVRDQQGMTPLGLIAEQMLGIDINPDTYFAVGPEASGGTATELEMWGERFQIREWRADGIGPYIERYIVYVTSEGGP